MTLVSLSNSAQDRIKEIRSNPENAKKFLRISIASGGCSEFQYIFELDNKINEKDIKIFDDKEEVFALTDEISLPFLEGAQIDFVKELGASYFKVNNPNAKSKCGCGSSFSI